MQRYEFISNINQLYKPALGDNQIPFYNDFLETFSDKFLDVLWETTMHSHVKTSPPSIGELNKYSVGIVIASEEKEKREQEAKPVYTEEMFLGTRLGKLALKQGWASSYVIYCQDNGIPKQDDDMLLYFQKAQDDAKRGFETLSESDGWDRALIKLYNSMREKNAEYQAKYLN